MLKKMDLFRAGEGFPCYRIPGIVATKRGTLIAYCETRLSGDDWEAHGVCARRSVDGGQTWGEQNQLVAMREKTVNNPMMIACENGDVHFFWQEDYKALYHQVSTDDGVSFSSPESLDILESYRDEYDWTCSAIGPGHGIETKDGALILPVWLAKGEGRKHFPSVVSSIRFDADGWKRGDIVYSQPEIGFDSPNETAVAQLGDGTLYFSMRHRGSNQVRYHVTSADGLHFTPPKADGELPDPRCFGSLCGAGQGRVLFANCSTCGFARDYLMVRLSDDGCKTWSRYPLVEPRAAGYADVMMNAQNKVCCFYERGHKNGNADVPEALTLAVFDLNDIGDERASLNALAHAVQKDAAARLREANIVLTEAEEGRIEVADMGLSRLTQTGLELITYINTERCCAKELVLLPGQTCPEHIHPTIDGVPGKEETFRCRAGLVYLYVSGDKTDCPATFPPCDDAPYYTAGREIVLHPGEQFTIKPDTPHWFKGGPKGAIVSEFSTASHDETDIFRHPGVKRTPLL